ncbi:MAG: fluoride efflux transporter CrcB [bacterium]|nr:fluoride efflux transporter CrcB [bacterium]
MRYIILAIGGALGAILRYLVSIYFSKLFGNYFPIGTLIVNIIGSFILGFFMGLILEKLPPTSLRKIFIAIGFSGSFTTMSSLSYETLVFIIKKQYFKAGINVFLNISLCLISTFIGYLLAKKIKG